MAWEGRPGGERILREGQPGGERPSMTAQRVAAHRLTFERVPAPYGNAQADVDLARDVAGGAGGSAGRMHEYLRARTAFFDRVLVGALDRGVGQVVVGAAGYDGRAWRYAKPGVRWFELDHPVTQRDKVARLARLKVPSGHIDFVAADFAVDPVAERLLAAGLDPRAETLFMLEGVAVYLELAVLDRLLRELRKVAANGSTLAISVSVGSAGLAAREEFGSMVSAMGEPPRSVLEAGEAEGLLRRTGWERLDGDATDEGGATSGGPAERATAERKTAGTGAQARRVRLRGAGFLLATTAGAGAVRA